MKQLWIIFDEDNNYAIIHNSHSKPYIIMPNQIIVNNTDNNANTYLTRKVRSFACFQLSDNLVQTPLVLNEWTQFAEPTGGLIKQYDNANDFTVNVGNLGITYTGLETKTFNLSAVTNVFKAALGAATRTLELQWKINGNLVGFKRQVQSNTESNIYTGNGFITLSTGAILTPWVRNIENSDGVMLDNASFTLSQELTEYYGE